MCITSKGKTLKISPPSLPKAVKTFLGRWTVPKKKKKLSRATPVFLEKGLKTGKTVSFCEKPTIIFFQKPLKNHNPDRFVNTSKNESIDIPSSDIPKHEKFIPISECDLRLSDLIDPEEVTVTVSPVNDLKHMSPDLIQEVEGYDPRKTETVVVPVDTQHMSTTFNAELGHVRFSMSNPTERKPGVIKETQNTQLVSFLS